MIELELRAIFPEGAAAINYILASLATLDVTTTVGWESSLPRNQLKRLDSISQDRAENISNSSVFFENEM